MKSLQIKSLSILLCLFFTLGIVLAFKGFPYFVDLVKDFRGYDYEVNIARQYEWIGPKQGEVIDLNYLVNINGNTLHGLPKNNLILLTVIDPTCGACKLTKEQFRFLDENLESQGVDRFLVCFSQKVSPSDLSDYVKSLHLTTNSLSWSGGLESVLPSIQTIVFPSHILIDSNGTVIKSFPGTDAAKRVRDRMVNRVLQEVLTERDRRNSTRASN